VGYSVGIDLGTTYTAAATEAGGRVEMVTLSNHSAVMPSVVFLRSDETLLTGDPASRRGVVDPVRYAREFKRRLGDEVPIMLGASPYSSERLMAVILRDVLQRINKLEGGEPDNVAISHPANWGPYKVELLRQAASLAGIADAKLISEPEAAAVHYAAVERIEPGQSVAVYDLGGGTFDAAVLRRTADGFEILGEPSGIERLGGIDFDAAVFEHVRRTLGTDLEDMDQRDPMVIAALATMRQSCTEAKEALSDDVEAVVNVMLPSIQTSVRITRSEFEDMVRPLLRETVEALRRALGSAAMRPDELTSVLLVGGSSRIPLVGEMVSREIGRPVAVDTHPKHVVALGAARTAGASRPGTAPADLDGGESSSADSSAPRAEAPDQISGDSEAPEPSSVKTSALNPVLVGGGIALLVVAVLAVFLVVTRGSEDPALADGSAVIVDTSTTTTTTSIAAATTVSSTTTTTPPSTTAASVVPVVPTCDAVSGLCAVATGIQIVGGSYVTDYETIGFTPRIQGVDADFVAGDRHVHFFWNDVLPANAGVNGDGTGTWMLWGLSDGGGQPVFDGFSVSDRPAGVRQMCVVVADGGHNVLDGGLTGNCLDLPT